MTVNLSVKISKHASVLSNDPLMHSNSTRFKKKIIHSAGNMAL